MSFAEYVEWNSYFAIEPFGDYRADLRAAVVSAASQAPHVTGNPSFEDFILFKEDRFDEVDEDDEEAVLDRILDRAARASERDG